MQDLYHQSWDIEVWSLGFVVRGLGFIGFRVSGFEVVWFRVKALRVRCLGV